MTIIAFVEGALPRKGGIGIMGGATSLRGMATHGHRILVAMGGPPSPGKEHLVAPDPDSGFARKEGTGTFGVVTFQASGIWAFSPALLLKMGRFVKQADFVSMHSIYSFPVFAGYLLARLHGKPYGIWPHGVFAPVQRTISVRKKWLYDKLIGKRILKHASIMFFSAKGEREEAAPLRLPAPSVIIPDGFDPSAFTSLPPAGAFRERYLSGYQGPLILFLARLNAKKGLDLLAEAMTLVSKKCPDYRLAIVGPPDPANFLNQVRAWVRHAGIESRTVFTGMIDQETKLQAFADTDVYVLPSHAENFGLSVFEAMASRVPVIVSNTLNYAGDIAAAQAGLSVPRTPEDFAGAILRLLENPEERRRLGNNGFHLAHRYSVDETALKVERTIESILHRRPLPPDLTH